MELRRRRVPPLVLQSRPQRRDYQRLYALALRPRPRRQME